MNRRDNYERWGHAVKRPMLASRAASVNGMGGSAMESGPFDKGACSL